MRGEAVTVVVQWFSWHVCVFVIKYHFNLRTPCYHFSHPFPFRSLIYLLKRYQIVFRHRDFIDFEAHKTFIGIYKLYDCIFVHSKI